jgi:adenine-specific DNA-methyltransferase
MSTDPGDLVLDPTCGSGTTATVAEQWGRRWITIDTSRVALALARARVMGARYPYYLLADTHAGQRKEAEVSGTAPDADAPLHGDIRHGFVCKRVPHITLKAIANNHEIDVIWDKWQATLEPLRAEINRLLGRAVPDGTSPDNPLTLSPSKGEATGTADSLMLRQAQHEGGESDQNRGVASPTAGHPSDGEPGSPDNTLTLSPSKGEGEESALEEWDLPREAPGDWPDAAAAKLADWWEGRIARQTEIDAAIARQADQEILYDQPYEDTSRVRVAGPFTFESLSPHRVVPGDEAELWDEIAADAGPGEGPGGPVGRGSPGREADPGHFTQVVLDHLRSAGVQQSHKDDRIVFTSLTAWPGAWIAAEGRFMEGEHERKAGVFIGPEFGTVARGDLVAAAREAVEAGFDLLIACAFSYDAHATEFNRLGALRVVRARMNPDLHMAETLKNTGTGNLFVVFGEPDLEIEPLADGQVRVQIHGLDIFDPTKGEVRGGGTEDIAAWFIDTDYNEESFFVRHAYFLGGHDPYKSLKTALKAEIDQDAWETLRRDVSRPFPRPNTGRIAVKVINHFGDEVMQVFEV